MTDLWPHQQAAVDMLGPLGHGVLGMDVGTGKSLAALALFKLWDCRRVLILCPLGMVNQWPKEFQKHGFAHWLILPLHKGSTAQRASQFLSARSRAQEENVPFAAILNYEAILSADLSAAIISTHWDCIACDESQKIKGQAGKASKLVAKLCRGSAHAIALTGTLLHDTPLDAFGQLRAIAPEVFGDDWFRFQRHYAITLADQLRQDEPKLAAKELAKISALVEVPKDQRKEFAEKYGAGVLRHIDSGQWPPSGDGYRAMLQVVGRNYVQWRLKKAPFMRGKVAGYKNRDEFQAKVACVTYHCTKRDVLSLPPVIHVNRSCALGARGRAAYDAELKRAEAKIAADEDALVSSLRLRQIISGYMPGEDGEVIETGDEKAMLLSGILEELPRDEPVVVFGEFRHDFDVIHVIAKAAGRTSCEVSGPRKELEAFQSGEANLIAVQYKAGGAGLDLKYSCYPVFFTHCWSLGDYDQALGRVDRAGQTRPVTVFHLVIEATIEEKVLVALAEKRDVAEAIMQDLRYQGDGSVPGVAEGELDRAGASKMVAEEQRVQLQARLEL